QAEAGSDRAPEAMRRVAETGRESLAEMRRLLGVLRAPDDRAELAPQPVAESIGALVARFRDAGMPVTWTAEGPALPPGGASRSPRTASCRSRSPTSCGTRPAPAAS